ncbi:MAG: hypothetical protein JW993_04795 [Sedimentisphaerales bacterium]|nr:hypothetical protein [Sedimentisphaerales bacterium]
MEHESIRGLEPEKVARLVGVTLARNQGERRDSEEAIKDLLEICLTQTCWAQDGRQGGRLGVLGRLLRPRRSEAKRTLREVLLDRRSGLNMVSDVRRHAKQQTTRTDDEVKHAVMTTIYFAAIASALVFHGRRISTYSPESLRCSFAKLCRKTWMPAELVELFEKADEACRGEVRGSDPPRKA